MRLAQRITLGEHGATEDWIHQTEKSISGVFEILQGDLHLYSVSFFVDLTDKILVSKERMSELLSNQAARVEEH